VLLELPGKQLVGIALPYLVEIVRLRVCLQLPSSLSLDHAPVSTTHINASTERRRCLLGMTTTVVIVVAIIKGIGCRVILVKNGLLAIDPIAVFEEDTLNEPITW